MSSPPRLKSLLTSKEVPAVIREPFLLTGYRPLGLGVRDSILSGTVWLSNETFNVWTHLIPAAYFLWLSGQLALRVLSGSHDIALYLPLILLELSTGLTLLTSSVAHCFNCMSARARHTCFFCDYGAIAIYSIISGLAHFYYCGLMPSDKPSALGSSFIEFPLNDPPVFYAVLTGIHATVFWATSMTRHHWRPLRYLIRTLNYMVAFNFNMMPFWSRSVFSTSNVFESTSYYLFKWQFIWNGLAALANVTKLPERLFPGRFDIIGHSHQWMHIFLTWSLVYEVRGVELDIKTRYDELIVSPRAPSLLVCSLLTTVFAVWTVWSIIWLHNSLNEDGSLRTKKKSK